MSEPQGRSTGQLLTTKEAAELLNIDIEAARKWLQRNGYEPVSHLGRNNLWSRKQINQAKKERVGK